MAAPGSSKPSTPPLLVLLVGLAVAACGGGTERYPAPGAPPPIAWIDTLPIAEPAAWDGGDDPAEVLTEILVEQPGHVLSVSRLVSGIPPALNVGPFDDVVPSSWFESRITASSGVTPTIAARGPAASGPDVASPLTVIAGKLDGVTPGFTVRDAKGDVYLFKVDPPGMSGLGSGADVVSSRIFWAAGFHVPKDVVARIDPSRLVLADDAEVETEEGERPMTQADIDAALDRTDRADDGSVRILASLFLRGTPKGPFRFEGRREDDPNDYYPHEDRRELRGMWVLAAWVNHVDLRVQNTLDMYIEPPGYLRHHVIDFATTLGSGSIRALNPREGMEFAFDVVATVSRWATLGFYRVGWEGEAGEPPDPALGWIDRDFDPGSWKPFIPAESLRRLTERDGYWGAKLVAAFDEEHLEAIIGEADYPRDAGDTLLSILLSRRAHVLRHWFGEVAPVEQVSARLTDEALVVSFRDLGLDHAIWSAGETTYEWRLRAPELASQGGRSVGEDAVSASAAGTRAGPGQRVAIPIDASVRAALGAASEVDPLRLGLRVVRPGSTGRWAEIRLREGSNGEVLVSGLIH